MKQLVSILIPAYNAEKWIGDCIMSGLAQTWPWKEIIVVNDGSKDSTLEIALSYASKNIKVVNQENSGASAARNKALSMANGDYIQWLDADDLLAPDKIATQMSNAVPGEVSKILLSCSWGSFYYKKEKAKFIPDALWEDLDPKEWLYRKINGNLWMASMSWLVSRRLTEMSGPWNESLSLDDDGEYFLRVINNAERIRFICNARCYRRISNGMSSPISLNNFKLDSQAFALFSYINTLTNMENSHRTRSACVELLNRWAAFFYPERPDIIHRMQREAENLGMQLVHPVLRPRYRLVQKIFGWRIAKKAQYTLPKLRFLISKSKEQIIHLFRC